MRQQCHNLDVSVLSQKGRSSIASAALNLESQLTNTIFEPQVRKEDPLNLSI